MAPNPRFGHGLLWRAAFVSLLLHALLLLQPGIEGALRQAPQPLLASLTPRTENRATHLSTAPVVKNAAPVTSPLPARSGEVVPQAADAPAPAARSDRRGEVAQLPSAAAGNADIDFGEAKKSYLFAIAAEAGRARKSSARAMAVRSTGTAEVSVKVNAGGNPQMPTLSRSSGNVDIDEAALSMVAIALKRASVPDNLRARDFDLVLPMSFSVGSE